MFLLCITSGASFHRRRRQPPRRPRLEIERNGWQGSLSCRPVRAGPPAQAPPHSRYDLRPLFRTTGFQLAWTPTAPLQPAFGEPARRGCRATKGTAHWCASVVRAASVCHAWRTSRQPVRRCPARWRDQGLPPVCQAGSRPDGLICSGQLGLMIGIQAIPDGQGSHTLSG